MTECPAGSVGAGTGATVGKWAGIETRMKGGIGVASTERGGVVVAACAVVNSVGDVIGPDGSVLAGARDSKGTWMADLDADRSLFRGKPSPHANTTLAVVMTNARLSKVDVNRVARRGQTGFARAIKPVHTSYDGDLVFALASGEADATVDLVAEMGADLVAEAIRTAVLEAVPLGGVPACRGGEEPGR